MWKDPIVEEIHAVREEIARRFNYDLGEIVAYLRAQQEAGSWPVVGKQELARCAQRGTEQEPELNDAA